ncbi:transcriptional regulator with XRE-family HTH domain [Streptacidiphilus sp. BW17]|uniref:helix-turn-helix domain-containing protein n=1 Tax=Streptacidiphilus sp. BW17 TaxID=3156274 RepID=UPI0035131F7E
MPDSLSISVGQCRLCGTTLAADNRSGLCSPCQHKSGASSAPEVPSDFWDAEPLRKALADRHIGQVIRAYRQHPFHRANFGRRGIPQSSVGDWLVLTQAQVSRIESGSAPRNLDTLIHIARTLRIPSDLLWFTLPQDKSTATEARHLPRQDGHPDPAVRASQDAWRAVRRRLNTDRAVLADAAVQLYDPDLRVESTALLASPAWLAPEPVPLERVSLRWDSAPVAPILDGTAHEGLATRPLRLPDQRFDRYTLAVRYLDSPTLFENRPSYRLTGVRWDDDGTGELRFSLATYFDKLDLCEGIGHEFAAAAELGSARPRWGQLALRRAVGDPFDLRIRPMVPAITTLLLRRRADGDSTFFLHWRDPGRVATAGGLYDAIPAGEFQPSSVLATPDGPDFDLWRNIVRELNEELLGAPEFDGSAGQPLDYDRWPLYRALQRGRETGAVRAYCFGVGCDALTLAATIPSVLVIDDAVFDELFGDIALHNAEGITVAALSEQQPATGIPFTEQNVTRFLRSEPVAPPGAACLALAWKHRRLLLTP